MSANFATHYLQQRNEFLQHLNNDYYKINQIIDETTTKINQLNNTIDNIRILSEKIEHTALIPLGKRIFVDGQIKHTHEYFLDQLAYPNSYTIEDTKDNIIKLLELRVKQQQKVLETNQQNRQQLEKRMELLKGDNCNVTTDDRPKEIVSDRGVAVRVGEFYEILEFEQ